MKRNLLLIIWLFSSYLLFGSGEPGKIGNDQVIPYNSKPAKFVNVQSPNDSEYLVWYYSTSPTFGFGIGISGSNSTTYQETEYLKKNRYYRRRNHWKVFITEGDSYSNIIKVTVQVYGGSIGSDQNICYNTIPSSILNVVSPDGGDGVYTYKWLKSTNNGASWEEIPLATSLSYVPNTPLTQTTWYKRQSISEVENIGESNIVKVNVYSEIGSGNIALDQQICYNGIPNPIVETSSATGGGGVYTYSWRKSVNGGTVWETIPNETNSYLNLPALAQSTKYKRIVSSGSCGTAESNIVTINVYPMIVSGVVGQNQSICYNTSPSSFTNINLPTGGSGSFTYQWKFSDNGGTDFSDIQGATGITYTESDKLVSERLYKRIEKNAGCESVESNTIKVTVLTQVNPGVVSNSQTICYLAQPSILTGTAPSGGNGSYTFQWQKSVDATNWDNIPGEIYENYTPQPLTQSTFYRRLTFTSSCGSAASNVVKISVHNQLLSGSIGSDHTICYGSTSNTINNLSNPSGGSISYILNWYKSEDNGNSWENLNVNTASLNSMMLSKTTQFKRVVTDALCGTASSAPVTVTVRNPLISGGIGSDQNIYTNTIPSKLIGDAPSGGDGVYSFKWRYSINSVDWFDIINSDNRDYQPSALTNSTFYKRVTNSFACGSVESNIVKITVYSSLFAGTLQSNQNVCYNGIPGILTSTDPIGGTGVYTFKWQKSPEGTNWTYIEGETNPTLLLNSHTSSMYYRREVTSGGVVVYSNSIRISVYPFISKPLTDVKNYYCSKSNVIVNVTNPSTYTYKWYNDSNGFLQDGRSITIPSFVENRDILVKAFDTNGCSSEAQEVNLRVDPIKASFTSDVNTVTVGNSVRFTNTSINRNYSRWNFYDGDIIFEDSPVHYYNVVNENSPKVFNVSLLVRSSGGCEDSVKIVNAITVTPLNTGLDSETLNTVSVYPNPSSDYVYVKSEVIISKINVYNVIGGLVKSESYNKSDVSLEVLNLKEGIYILEVTGEKGKVLGKYKVVKR